MTLLSIVVPVYGVEPWIETCLRSIVDQPEFARSCELVIVDDGSPDRSVEIAERVCAGRDNVRILRQANQGLGAARNAGAAVVKGDFLWFVDSDDWLTPDGLERIVEALRAAPGVEVLNLDYVMSNGMHSTVLNRAVPDRDYDGVDYLACSFVQNPVQYYVWSTGFYRRQGLRFEVGLYHEDTLFTPTGLSQARRVRRLAADCYVYNLREGSIMSSGKALRHAQDMVSVVDRLEAFRRDPARARLAAQVLARYSAVAVGGIYYYWKQLPPGERAMVSRRLRWWALLRPVLRSGRWKYAVALARMGLVRRPSSGTAA